MPEIFIGLSYVNRWVTYKYTKFNFIGAKDGLTMINKHEINREQVLYAVKTGEFGSDVISSKATVAVIMTQDWCPQWHNMKGWVYGLKTENDIDIYELIYNNTDFFDEFKNFKESQWKNHEIPYLRLYKNGRFFKETNYIGKEEFIRNIEG